MRRDTCIRGPDSTAWSVAANAWAPAGIFARRGGGVANCVKYQKWPDLRHATGANENFMSILHGNSIWRYRFFKLQGWLLRVAAPPPPQFSVSDWQRQSKYVDTNDVWMDTPSFFCYALGIGRLDGLRYWLKDWFGVNWSNYVFTSSD